MPWLRLDRHVWRTFQIDANRINSRGSLENMHRLERWAEDDVIALEMSQVAQEEAAAGGDASRREKAYKYGATETLSCTPGEKMLLQRIGKILYPGGGYRKNWQNDVELIFNAIKHEAILVTSDGASKRQPGGILGRRDELMKLGATILTDDEAVRLVEKLIEDRDAMAVRLCKELGEPLPEWIGKD